MANQPESAASYPAGVYQLETTDPVQGGVGGVSNTPLLQLANRTAWLKAQYDALAASIGGYATLASPVFTGDPRAPTAPAEDNDTTIATTAWARRISRGILSVNVAGGANVALTAADAGNGMIVLTGLLTANIAVTVPVTAGRWIVFNNTTGAFTLTFRTVSGAGIAIVQGRIAEVWSNGTDILQSQTHFDSIAMTGAPTATTASPGDDSTRVATTAFVAAVARVIGGGRPMVQVAFTSPGTSNWTVPAGVTRIRIRAWGGGAGGGGNTTAGGGGGGGGGGYAEGVYSVTPGQVLEVGVGAAGTAGSNSSGSASGNNGGNGGASFVTGLLSAAGGIGGGGSLNLGAGNSGAGGAGSGGVNNMTGGDGQAGVYSAGVSFGGQGGSGAAGGGGGAASTGLPTGGNFPGGGGAGAGSNFGGGAGAAGQVIIEHAESPAT